MYLHSIRIEKYAESNSCQGSTHLLLRSHLSAASELTALVPTSSADRKKTHTFIQRIETSWRMARLT